MSQNWFPFLSLSRVWRDFLLISYKSFLQNLMEITNVYTSEFLDDNTMLFLPSMPISNIFILISIQVRHQLCCYVACRIWQRTRSISYHQRDFQGVTWHRKYWRTLHRSFLHSIILCTCASGTPWRQRERQGNKEVVLNTNIKTITRLVGVAHLLLLAVFNCVLVTNFRLTVVNALYSIPSLTIWLQKCSSRKVYHPKGGNHTTGGKIKGRLIPCYPRLNSLCFVSTWQHNAHLPILVRKSKIFFQSVAVKKKC